MSSEWRPETCPDCDSEREREWLVRTVAKGMPIPKGWRRSARQPLPNGSWKTIEGRTRWTTLCLCDTP